MGLFYYLTPSLYPILTVLWFMVMVVALRHAARKTYYERETRVLLLFMALMAFCFLVECIYFGVRYSAYLGLLPAAWHPMLEQPELTFIPKALHVLAAATILVVFLRFYLRQLRVSQEANELRYKNLVDSLDAIVWEGDAATLSFRYVSPQAERLLGYPVAQWYEKDFWVNHIHPEDRKDAVQFCAAATARKEDHRFEYRFRAADGRYLWIEDRAAVIIENDEAKYLRGLLVDVTARREAAVAQAAYQKRIEDQVHALADIATNSEVTENGFEAGLKVVARHACVTLGVRRFGCWLLEEDGARLRAALVYDAETGHYESGASLFARDFPLYFEAMQNERCIAASDAHQDPRTREVAKIYAGEAGIDALLDAPLRVRGHVVGTICIEHTGSAREWFPDECVFASTLADQTAQLLLTAERRQIEEEQGQLLAAIEQAGEGIVIMDREGRVQYVNEAYLLTLKEDRGEIVGKPATLLTMDVEDEGVVQLRRAWKKDEVWHGRIRIPGAGAGDAVLEITFSPVQGDGGAIRAYVAVLLDVSYQQALEERMRHTQRMESIGLLAGGIAHDFNNILQAIIGNIELARSVKPVDAEVGGYLRGAYDAADRAAALTTQLLAFSRRQILQPKNVEVNTLIQRFLEMGKRIIGEDIRLLFRPALDAGVIKVDVGQIEQVLLNLCVNARDAMPRGGTIVIESGVERIAHETALGSSSLGPGLYARISVIDQGGGMTPETVSRLFEPFFTTKELGNGTGLGLATAYGIVRQHNGNIMVESELDKGSTFHVYLPKVSESPQTLSAPVSGTAVGGNEAILVVDDNASVRDVTAKLLRSAGYTVDLAVSGEEAIAKFQSAAPPYALVMMDVLMPGMNGAEAAERITAIREVPILFASGFSGGGLAEKVPGFKPRQLIQKPFERHVMLRAVREALDGVPERQG